MIVKLSAMMLVGLSAVAILSTGCTTPPPEPVDNSSVLTEDDWNKLLEDSSAAAGANSQNSYAPEEPSGLTSPVLLDLLRGQEWHIGPEVYYYKYKEPSVMKTTGVFYGLVFSSTSRYWVPASPQEKPWKSKWMGRVEGRFAYGQVDYDGALMDGTPYTMDDVDDFVWELRLLMGPDFPQGNHITTPFVGIAYRYLNDDSSFDPAGYERESNYVYIPLGIETLAQLNEDWLCGASVEIDVFLWGQQSSHLGGGVGTVDNRQDNGYGARASVKFQKKGDKVDFIIEPFIRYWDIGASKVVAGLVEPKNYTVEAGVQLVWAF